MQIASIRLSTIAARQRTNRVRDLLFVALVVFASGLAAGTVATAIQAAQC